MNENRLIVFCRKKESEARAAAATRMGMSESLAASSNAEWKSAAEMMGAKYIPRKQRMKLSAMDIRIAQKHALEAETYKEIAEALKRACELSDPQ